MLKLYTTSHCHLCDEAFSLLLQICSEDQVSLIEISEDQNLINNYGQRIPVLQRLDTLEELGWPFNSQELVKFLGH
jgi:hypothetical protein